MNLKNKLTILTADALVLAGSIFTVKADELPDNFTNEEALNNVGNAILNTIFSIADVLAIVVVAGGLLFCCFKYFSDRDNQSLGKFIASILGVVAVGLVLLYLDNVLAIFGFSVA